MKISLPDVTLIGIDCKDLERLQLAANISCRDIAFGSVKLLTSIKSDDSRVVQIAPITSTRAYSEFVIKELYKYVDTKYALVFQYDGFVLNADGWWSDFLSYDYIGAPWYHLGNLHVGNGGFSLRSRQLMEWLAKNHKKVKAKIHPEDVFVSKFARPLLEKEGMAFAPEDVAARFSKEGNEHSVIWNGEFGFHGIKYTDISKWLDVHPEYKDRLSYKLDDYCKLMKKYPVYDGTVHTLRFNKYTINKYIQLAKGEADYEIRLTQENHTNLNNLKEGHTAVFKRSGVKFADVPIPAFERKIIKKEVFPSLAELRRSYPENKITVDLNKIPKWKRLLIKITGDAMLPKNSSYTVLRFR